MSSLNKVGITNLQARRIFVKAAELEQWSVEDKNENVKVEAVVTTVESNISNPYGPKRGWVPRSLIYLWCIACKKKNWLYGFLTVIVRGI